MRKTIFLLSLFFVFLSFYPTLYEIREAKYLPKERVFELVHNYVFDYNFYLSRIREGQEGRWLMTEKYYNKPHTPSLFQIFYLLLGKVGGFAPPTIYHLARLLMGLMLLMIVGFYVRSLFHGWWSVIAYLLVVTAGSWPILVKAGESFRFATYWGGWSVIDSLQRITFLPHVLAGQIFLVLFVWKFLQTGRATAAEVGHDFFPHPSTSSGQASLKLRVHPEQCEGLKKHGLPAAVILGLISGIIFPPVLITVYAIFAVMTVLDLVGSRIKSGMTNIILPKIIFVIFSLPALLYTQIMFKVDPWKALAIFDIQHRSILPYSEYALALGPMLPLGILGGLMVLGRLGGLGRLGEREERLIPIISWTAAIFLLFVVFERVPQQSPTRFTQMLINVPLGILSTYFFYQLWQMMGRRIKGIIVITIISIILLGLGVMLSMVGWKTDEVKGKMAGTWLFPVGVQLVYPLKDFMEGINYLKNNTTIAEVVLAYEAAGNYIPAYAGNFVYLGHANTPDEDGKLKIAARFFKGEMSVDEAKEFLSKENIKYIYFGPQEREVGNIDNLSSNYNFITPIYTNIQVTIYKFSI